MSRARSVLQLTSVQTLTSSFSSKVDRLQQLKDQLNSIPSFDSFLLQSRLKYGLEGAVIASRKQCIPYLDEEHLDGQQKPVFVETYGCQMNVNDSQIGECLL